MSEKYDWRNNQKKTKKGCMPFCHSLRSSISKVVSTRKSKATRENKKKKQPQEEKGEETI